MHDGYRYEEVGTMSYDNWLYAGYDRQARVEEAFGDWFSEHEDELMEEYLERNDYEGTEKDKRDFEDWAYKQWDSIDQS